VSNLRLIVTRLFKILNIVFWRRGHASFLVLLQTQGKKISNQGEKEGDPQSRLASLTFRLQEP
jgi:hypothetical protein